MSRTAVTAGLLAFVLCFPAVFCQTVTNEKQPRWYAELNYGGIEERMLATVASGVSNTECVATPSDIYGPYYMPGVPFKDPSRNFCPPSTQLPPEAQPVSKVTIKGRVYDATACNQTVNGTKYNISMELWQANNAGDYDMVSTNCRTKIEIRPNGKYSFKTILPASYGQPNCLRPAHIHMRVVPAFGYHPLVTQLYFRGEPYLGVNDCGCGGACNSGNKLLQLKLKCDKKKENCDAKFDIYLIHSGI